MLLAYYLSHRLQAQIQAFVPRDFHVLGTDGFGRSDSRQALRHHFEVDRHYVVLTTLSALARKKGKEAGGITVAKVKKAIEKYGIDPDRPNPLYA